MQIIQVAAPSSSAYTITARLKSELATSRSVLWLLSGGSNIALEKEIMEDIETSLTSKLTITLTDERFGPVGHADSNWQQLQDAGFDPKLATAAPVLMGETSLEEAAARYAKTFERLVSSCDTIIGLFGMGPDGHISGILPHTEAATAEGYICGYHTEQYDRITTTFEAIKKCQVAYLVAFGDAKREALENLEQDLSLVEQPAQILKQVREAYVYNDQIGDML